MSWQINALHFGTLAVAPSQANNASHLSDRKISLGGHRGSRFRRETSFKVCSGGTSVTLWPSQSVLPQPQGLWELLALPLQAESLCGMGSHSRLRCLLSSTSTNPGTLPLSPFPAQRQAPFCKVCFWVSPMPCAHEIFRDTTGYAKKSFVLQARNAKRF